MGVALLVGALMLGLAWGVLVRSPLFNKTDDD